MDDYLRSFECAFRKTPHEYLRRQRSDTTLYLGDKRIYSFLLNFGNYGSYVWNLDFKQWPARRLFWKNFMQTAFEGDGTVHAGIKKQNDRKKRRRRYLLVCRVELRGSPNGLLDVKRKLAELFEIKAMTIEKGLKLQLNWGSVKKFKNAIDFASKRKRRLLRMGVKYFYEAFETKDEAQKFLHEIRRAAVTGKKPAVKTTKIKGKNAEAILKELAAGSKTTKQLSRAIGKSRGNARTSLLALVKQKRVVIENKQRINALTERFTWALTP
ncbi:MAG: hypothetical protein V1811_00355 [Candidatus Micrarchaeota archaeon]